MIDESRKLLKVHHIIDTYYFAGVWRGTIYEVRAVPDTNSLAVGDLTLCHIMPGNTALVAVLAPKVNIIVIWSGLIADIPAGWYFCDGTHGTPDLRDRFIRAAHPSSVPPIPVNSTGGVLTQTTTHYHVVRERLDGTGSHWHHADSVTTTNCSYAGETWPEQGANYASTWPHEHTVPAIDSETDGLHDHEVLTDTDVVEMITDITPPYYALAYIMGNGTLPLGAVGMTHGNPALLPSGYCVCDGTLGTPDLRWYFQVGANRAAYNEDDATNPDAYPFDDGYVGYATYFPTHWHHEYTFHPTSETGHEHGFFGDEGGAKTVPSWSDTSVRGGPLIPPGGYGLRFPHEHSFDPVFNKHESHTHPDFVFNIITCIRTSPDSTIQNVPAYYSLYFIKRMS